MGNRGSNTNTATATTTTQNGPVTSTQFIVTPPSHYPNPNLPTNYYTFHQNYHTSLTPHQNYHRCPPVAPPRLEQQLAVTIRVGVNVHKDSFVLREDPASPGEFLLGFDFDATSPGTITVAFFAKEGDNGNLISTKEEKHKLVSVPFEEGPGQKFEQPAGTGIDFSAFEETELKEVSGEGIYPVVVKVEACSVVNSGNDGKEGSLLENCYIALAVFDKKESGEHAVRVVKQILWVNGARHELKEIYGIGNSVDVDSDEGDLGRECVICMTEQRDTTVLPCRHMCLCSRCARVLHLQKHYRCPICRQPVESLLEIKVNNDNQSEV